LLAQDDATAAPKFRIALAGDQDTATKVTTLKAVQVTRAGVTESFALASRPGQDLALPAAATEAAGIAGFLKIARFGAGLTLSTTLRFTVAAGKAVYFGRTFDASSGLSGRIVLRIPPKDGPAPGAAPFFALTCEGSIEVKTGSGDFLAVTIGFEVAIESLPADFPTPSPGLSLALPEDLWLPKLRMPWSEFPTLPELPFRLPAFSIDLQSIPLQITWRSLDVTADTANTEATLSISGLRLVGAGAAVEADVAFTTKAGSLSSLAVTLRNPDRVLKLDHIHIEQGCLVLDWTGTEVNELLRLVSAEIADPTAAAANRLRLRVLGSSRLIDEVRLDWLDAGAATSRTLAVPGFTVTVPTARMYSLLAYAPAEPGTPHEGDPWSWRLSLLGTFAAGSTAVAKSTFSWTLDDTQKELHRDGDGNANNELVEITAEAKNDVTLVLLDVPLTSGGSKPAFVRQLEQPLPLLDFSRPTPVEDPDDDAPAAQPTEPIGLCAPTPTKIVSLSDADNNGDWKITPKFNFPNDFTLPFLNQKSGPTQQFLKIKSITPSAPDFAKHTIACTLDVQVLIGGLTFEGNATLDFDWERFAFHVEHGDGILLLLPDDPAPQTLFDLTWRFRPDPGTRRAFVLVTKDANYQLRMDPKAVLKVDYTRATLEGDPIVFRVTDFALTPKGVDLTATVTDRPARFNGLETKFRFTEGTFQVRENTIRDFSIAGSGPLPPALVGNAVADVALQFSQPDQGHLRLVRGGARLRGSKLLSCKGTRFEFSLDGLGLEFVDDGGSYHLYFTLSGTAKYAPLPGDNPSGPLAWMPKIQLQLIDCPLTGNMQVIARHVNFLVELPKKVTFPLLGCFEFELRGIGFLPQAAMFTDNGRVSSAMQVSGQVKFSDSSGDAIETKIDFHNLFVGLPKPGSFLPRLHMKGLGLKIKAGEAFEVEGEVDFFSDEPVEPGILGDGFAGSGSVTIQGLPTIAASFAFLRVSADSGVSWRRAWFLYLEARKLALQIPVIEIFIREIGIGFGYRYTLASIKTSDQINDPKQLLKELKRLSKTQGNLSRRDQWRIDLEGAGESPRWTIALRALISETSASMDPFGADYSALAEGDLPCLFVLDVVIALRSDLTFFMAGRAWLSTNYNDFRFVNRNNLQDKPLFSAFVLLSPRQKRFLANLSSNADAEFGDHPPLPDFLKAAIRSCRFSATLLIEPGLVHYELGWPNQLQWQASLGPLQAEFRGGTIFRASRTEVVVGNSFLARGHLDLKAELSLGLFGASFRALADVAYGARYIGVLAFDKPFQNSAFYGAVGVEIRVKCDVDFWIKIELVFTTIKLDFGFSFAINFTAALEVGITLEPDAGARGTATVAISVMGHDLHFGIRVGLNDRAVDKANDKTKRFLQVGLEAEDVEPIPGTQKANGAVPFSAAAGMTHAAYRFATLPLSGASLTDASSLDTQAAKTAHAAGFQAPNYILGWSPNATAYYLLLPAAEPQGHMRGFLPVPPDGGGAFTGHDFAWTPTAVPDPKIILKHYDPQTGWPTGATAAGEVKWAVDWEHQFDVSSFNLKDPSTPVPDPKRTLRQLLRYAFLYKEDNPPFGDFTPTSDPNPVPIDDQLSDPRVQDPSEAAFEAAVRGASDQFAAAPYLKFDFDSDYDFNAYSAFHATTSIYSETGKIGMSEHPLTKQLVPDPGPVVQKRETAIQLRGAVLQAIVRDFHAYTDADRRGDTKAMRDLERDSLAFRLGLVFRAEVEAGADEKTRELRNWLARRGATSKIKQRTDPTKNEPDAESEVSAFSTDETLFTTRAPEFVKVKQYAHAQTIAIGWQLTWSDKIGSAAKHDDPEHHLRHYRVHRLRIDGDEPEVEYTVRPADVLNRAPKDPEHSEKGTHVLRLRPRFQIVDHFNDETAGDLAALTEAGKTYLYTITPVDITGADSPRPLSVVATRRPCEPPQVPTDGEMVFAYRLLDDPNQPFAPRAVPAIRDCDVSFEWTDAPDAPGRPTPPIESYRLVFRRQTTLPVGFYGSDADTRGGRDAGLPTSNARPLRSDLFLTWRGHHDPDHPESVVHDVETGRTRRSVSFRLQELESAGVLPRAETVGEKLRLWRPEGWRIFVQSVSAAGVPSPLAPVAVRLRFNRVERPKAPPPQTARYEERKLGVLEWLPDPVRLNLLPPQDLGATVGFARVPMPSLEDAKPWVYKLDPVPGDETKGPVPIPGVTYEAHPDRTRAVQFVWNQGPSDDPSHPLDLHARYQLFEFDANAHPGDVLEPDPKGPRLNGGLGIDVNQWARAAGLRQVQDVELRPADDLPLSPADTLSAPTWEAWYPTSSRRLLVRRDMIANHTWPAESRSKFGPWYSWRDSYLEWPDPKGMFTADPTVLDAKLGPRLKRLHPLFRELVTRLAAIPEDTAPKTGGDPLPKYSVELMPALPRGQGDPADNPDVNALPDTPDDALSRLLKDTPPGADPYGWMILQRLGLCFALRVRNRRTGDYVRGLVLANLVRGAIKDALGAGYDDLRRFLHIEHLFQPARKTGIGRDEEPKKEDVDPGTFDALLALVQISLRPAVRQRMQYLRATFKDATVIPKAGTPLTLKLKASSDEASYLIRSGDRGAESTGLPAADLALPSRTEINVPLTMPPSGTLAILFRGVHPLKIDDPVVTHDGASTTLSVSPYSPTEWDSTYFLTPDKAPWTEKAGPPRESWKTLSDYAANVARVALPLKGTKIPDVREWLARFFNFGGDVVPNDGKTPVATSAGPWVASAYPRATTPIALTPSPDGRITYYHLVEDLWAHIYRYYVRPLGRYDLIWASLADSSAIFSADTKAAQQRALAILEAPKSGGLDIVIDRIRPLAAPLVLSTRRLDRPALTGRPVPPGATWEVIVAKHPEQTLVEKNRALADHLAYRQLAHTLMRQFAFAGPAGKLGKLLGRSVSRAFDDANSPVATAADNKVELVVDGAATVIDLTGKNELDKARAEIQATNPKLNASVKVVSGRTHLVLEPTSDILRVELRTTIGDPRSNLLSHPLRLRYEPAEGPRAPALPDTPAAPDHLDLDHPLGEDDGLSIDLPRRLARFTQGAVAFQWQALPFYYRHRLLLVAQAAAVVSPVTEVLHSDFQYVSPPVPAASPRATMEGVLVGNSKRVRRIVLTLARLWDALPADAQHRWAIEDPDSISDPKKRRYGSLPDHDAIYEVISMSPSGVVELLAEYRLNPDAATSLSGYESRPVPGPFKGEALRLLPSEDVDGAGKGFVRLETLLSRVAPEPPSQASQAITGVKAFPKAADRAPGVTFPPPDSLVLRIDLRLDPHKPPAAAQAEVDDALAQLRKLVDDPKKPRDAAFVQAVLALLGASGEDRLAAASIGLEALAEVAETVVLPTEAERSITWQGIVSADQRKVIDGWSKLSTFGATLTDLLAQTDPKVAFQPAPFAANPGNPDQTEVDAKYPSLKGRLTVTATTLTWARVFAEPLTDLQKADLKKLHDRVGNQADFTAAVAALQSFAEKPVAKVPVREADWHARPTPDDLPAVLKPRLLIGVGRLAFDGIMTRDEANALLTIPGLTQPDKAAVGRLFDSSLNTGLGGASLQVRVRRGSAAPVASPIQVTLAAVT
jgi:hypothetical protein